MRTNPPWNLGTNFNQYFSADVSPKKSQARNSLSISQMCFESTAVAKSIGTLIVFIVTFTRGLFESWNITLRMVQSYFHMIRNIRLDAMEMTCIEAGKRFVEEKRVRANIFRSQYDTVQTRCSGKARSYLKAYKEVVY